MALREILSLSKMGVILGPSLLQIFIWRTASYGMVPTVLVIRVRLSCSSLSAMFRALYPAMGISMLILVLWIRGIGWIVGILILSLSRTIRMPPGSTGIITSSPRPAGVTLARDYGR